MTLATLGVSQLKDWLKLAEDKRDSCGVSSRNLPSSRCSTDFGEHSEVRPDSWGWVPPRERVVALEGDLLTWVLLPSLRISPRNLRHTTPTMALSGSLLWLATGILLATSDS